MSDRAWEWVIGIVCGVIVLGCLLWAIADHWGASLPVAGLVVVLLIAVNIYATRKAGD